MLAKHRAHGGRSPVETNRQLIEHLQRTATDAGVMGPDPSYGYGLIDPGRVLESQQPLPVASEFRIGPLHVNGVAGCLVFVPQES